MNPTHTGYQIMTFIFCHNGLFSCSSIIISRTSLGLRISQTTRTSWRRQLGALGRYQRHMRPLSDVQIFDQSFKKRSHLVDRIFLFSDKRLLGPRCTSGVQSGFGWYLVFFFNWAWLDRAAFCVIHLDVSAGRGEKTAYSQAADAFSVSCRRQLKVLLNRCAWVQLKTRLMPYIYKIPATIFWHFTSALTHREFNSLGSSLTFLILAIKRYSALGYPLRLDQCGSWTV